mgnify:FL=1
MELTGKCKEEFDKWAYTEGANNSLELTCLKEFYNLPPSMQYGVLVDYFDSVKIFIQIETRIFDKEHPCYIYSKTVYNRVGCFNTRPEARTAAIEKAKELRNEALNK